MDKVRGGVIVFVLLILGLGGFWGFREFSKPLPGQVLGEQGRNHVPRSTWEQLRYTSNPPTSGPHDAEWVRSGIYDEPQGDGYLVHSLEHGYVIISYNCTKVSAKFPGLAPRSGAGRVLASRSHVKGGRSWQSSKLIGIVFAHEEEESSPSAEASPSGELSGDVWKNKECHALKDQLLDLVNKKRIWKLIVVPRPNLDSAIALTAWGRIDKFDTIDKERIIRFIDSYRDRGPERTME